MPTLAALLIVLAAIFPGILGDKIYRTLVGWNWREKDWQSVIRLLGFSIAGLTIYVVLAYRFGWPLPIYVFPSSFSPNAITPQNLGDLFVAYSGHFLGATAAGLVSGAAMRLLGRWLPVYPGAWDDFVRLCVSEHWVVVSTNYGDTYAGMIRTADVSVKQDERDIVLLEPAQFKEEENNYLALPYQSIFLPATVVSSIAVIHDPERDLKRKSVVGEWLFSRGTAESAKPIQGDAGTGPELVTSEKTAKIEQSNERENKLSTGAE